MDYFYYFNFGLVSEIQIVEANYRFYSFQIPLELKDSVDRTHTQTRQKAVPEEGKSHVAIWIFHFSDRFCNFQISLDLKDSIGLAHARCRQRAVPEGGKSHVALGIFYFFTCNFFVDPPAAWRYTISG